ncbi:MAG TPA: VOC family protein [Steroidobacteraceae bacterium]|nr:VOC family protein [Steroidobacteraceae bacterium]
MLQAAEWTAHPGTEMSLHHVSITTENLERLADFYCGLLGFEIVLELEWEAGNAVPDAIYGLENTAVRMRLLRLKSAFLELFEFRSPKGVRPEGLPMVNTPGYTHLCLRVTDIDAEYARLVAAGVRFNCPPQTMRGYCRATYARDPDGNLIELIEPVPGSVFDPDTPRRPS